MLTENPDVARSAFGPHRVIPDRWKGMSNDEIQAIRQEQENQRLENIRKAEQEKDKSNQWDLQKNSQAKAGILLEWDLNLFLAFLEEARIHNSAEFPFSCNFLWLSVFRA